MAKNSSNARNVASGNLSQKSGYSNSYGGYTKVNYGNGTFRMKSTWK